MDVNTILNLIFLVFAVLGGIDYLLDNRFGLGAEFERGIKCAGPLVLCMVGFMTLAPWLGKVLSPIAGPFLTSIGADPSLIAGLLLAVDSGGYVMASEMAGSEGAAILNGVFVGAMFGSAIMGNIPLSITVIRPEKRKIVLFGLAIGIAVMPFGCAAGGFLAGVDVNTIIGNMVPLTVLAALIVLAMIFASKVLEAALRIFGKITVAICVTGLIICVAGDLCHIEILPERMAFTEIMLVIGKICLCLAGVFPFLGVLLKIFEKPIERLAAKTGIGSLDIKCLIMNLVNSFSSIDRLNEMTDTGILLNCAFGVVAGYTLGDHFAYITSALPHLTVSFILGKLITGIMAVIAVLLLRKFIIGR